MNLIIEPHESNYWTWTGLLPSNLEKTNFRIHHNLKHTSLSKKFLVPIVVFVKR